MRHYGQVKGIRHPVNSAEKSDQKDATKCFSRRCHRCGKNRPVPEFVKKNGGFYNWCIGCRQTHNAYNKIRRKRK